MGYAEQDSHDGKTLAAYRKGNYKIISGSYKDSHWYMEPKSDGVNTSDNGLLVRFYELFARFMDWLFGEGPCDNFRMLIFNIWLFNHYAGSTEATKPLLFNIQDDPEEKFDLANKLPGVVEDLMKDVDTILKKRPKPPKYWLISRNWTDGFVPGNCGGQDVLKSTYCQFTDSWLSDDVDLRDEDNLDLVDIAVEANRDILIKVLLIIVLTVTSFVFCCQKCCCDGRGRKQDKLKES